MAVMSVDSSIALDDPVNIMTNAIEIKLRYGSRCVSNVFGGLQKVKV